MTKENVNHAAVLPQVTSRIVKSCDSHIEGRDLASYCSSVSHHPNVVPGLGGGNDPLAPLWLRHCCLIDAGQAKSAFRKCCFASLKAGSNSKVFRLQFDSVKKDQWAFGSLELENRNGRLR